MKGISKKDLSNAGFNCNVNENIARDNTGFKRGQTPKEALGLGITYDITYFGSSDKLFNLAAKPRKPSKRLISYIESLGYNWSIKEEYNSFWDKNLKYLKCY